MRKTLLLALLILFVSQQKVHAGVFSMENVGLGTHVSAWSSEYLSQQMQYVSQSNFRTIRFPIQWDVMQWDSNDKNYFNWNVYDALISTFPANVRVLGVLGPAIDWNGTPCSWNPTLSCTTWTNDIPDINNRNRQSPIHQNEYWSDWEMYVYQTVQRYGMYGQNKIQAWEILNEPDHPFQAEPYSDNQLVERGQQYRDLLIATERVIKLADPKALVVSAGLADYVVGSQPSNDLLERTKMFYDNFLDPTTAKLLNGVGIHPYRAVQGDMDSDNLYLYLQNLSQYINNKVGYAAPIWITEVGFTSSVVSNACEPYCQSNLQTENELMQKMIDQIYRADIESAYWYRLSPQGVEDNEVTSAPYSLVSLNSAGEIVVSPKLSSLITFNNEMQAQISGDGNDDKAVDGKDYVILLKHYGASTSRGQIEGDYNLDSIVDGRDYVVWLNNYSR